MIGKCSSRARLHFGDFARPKPELEPGDVDAVFSTRVPKLGTPEAETLLSQMRAAAERKRLRPSDSEIVWTAVRDEALNVALNDGRRLRIGGIIRHYSDEYADTRAYNDIIVMHSDGTIRTLAYPEEVFPMLAQFIGIVRGNHVFIFGIKYRERGRKEPRVPVTLRLNTSTFAIDRIAASPPTWTLFYEGAEILDGDRALFPCYYLNQADAEYRVAFDLTTFEWSEPFPDPHHASGNNAPISRNH
jgi:hypothetical protein